MKRFRFSLDPVLNWRSVQSDQEKSALERLHAEQRKIQSAQELALEQERETGSLLSLAQAVDGTELQRLAGYRAHLTRKGEDLQRMEKACEASVVEQRERCLEADRRRKLLEKLQKQQHTQWLAQTNRELDENASEIFLANWNRG